MNEWSNRNEVDEVTLNLPGKLFISSRYILNNYKSYNIGHLITLFDFSTVIQGIKHDIYNIIDDSSERTIDSLNELLSKIAQDIHCSLISGINVCVHCKAGISRSSTVVLDYLLTHHFQNFDDAYKYLLACRPIIEPNPGFMKLLQDKYR